MRPGDSRRAARDRAAGGGGASVGGVAPAPAPERPWLRHYDPGVPASLDYPSLTLDRILRRTASRHPRRPALTYFGREITYGRLDADVDRLAAGLRSLGLGDGHRVALLMANCPQLVMSCYAVWRAGGVVVPTNPRATAAEVARQLADAGVSIAITLDRLVGALAEARRDANLRHVVVAGVADYLPWPGRAVARVTRRGGGRRSRGASTGEMTITFGKLLESLPAAEPAAGPSTRDGAIVDGAAALLYTGGTTGTPKGALLTHANLVANACQVGAWASGLDDGAEVMLSALPLVHGYAMTACMNVSVLRGWNQVVVPDPRDLDRVLHEIERRRVTVFPGVPTLYAAICDHPGVRSGRYDLRSIEACMSGAAPLPAAVQEEFERRTGGRLVEGYGLTEASPATHCNPIGSGGRSGKIGLPLPDTDCRIVDVETETTQVAPGQPGILCVSGPQVMAAYWERPAETADVLRRDDEGRVWLHTGDVAEMAEDGAFRIVDRKKDIIVAAGGLKVYPNEIEDALFDHPKVRQAAVIGVPVGGFDQRAKAFVVLRQGERADADEILAFLRGRLATYKVPRGIEFRDELPLAFTGKVLRRVLAEEELRLEA